jgi:hypothetical protein
MLVQVKAGGQRARARNTHASQVCWVSNIARASSDFLQALASIKPPRRGCCSLAAGHNLATVHVSHRNDR